MIREREGWTSLLNPSPSDRTNNRARGKKDGAAMVTKSTHPVQTGGDRCVCVCVCVLIRLRKGCPAIGYQHAEQCIVGRSCFNVKSSCCSCTSLSPSSPHQEVVSKETPAGRHMRESRALCVSVISACVYACLCVCFHHTHITHSVGCGWTYSLSPSPSAVYLLCICFSSLLLTVMSSDPQQSDREFDCNASVPDYHSECVRNSATSWEHTF